MHLEGIEGSTHEGFRGGPLVDLEFQILPERRMAVCPHPGDENTVEETRRPLYQHMIMHELVGGPPLLRFEGDRLDVLVGATCGFDGDDVVTIELLPAGRYLVADVECPPSELPHLRRQFLADARDMGHEGQALYQLHLMDEIDGITEQQLQLYLGPEPQA